MKMWIVIGLMMFSSQLYGGVSIGNGSESFTINSDNLGASIYGQVKKLLRKLKKALKKEQLFRQGEFKRLISLIKSNDIELAQRVLEDYESKGGQKVDKAVKKPSQEDRFTNSTGQCCGGNGFLRKRIVREVA